MTCQKCGMTLPDDSEFCQYCGTPVEPSPIPAQIEPSYSETAPTSTPSISEPQSLTESPVEDKRSIVSSKTKGIKNRSAVTAAQSTDKNLTQEQKKKRSKYIAVVLIVAISIVALAALNILQFISYQGSQKRLAEKDDSIAELTAANEELTRINSEQEEKLLAQQITIEDQSTKLSEKDKEISQKSKEISEKDKKISSQESTINSQKSKISSLETKADYFTSISTALKSGNIGYAASNFNCSQSIILVKKGETKKITLTANWSNGGTVSLSYSNYAAYVDFDQSSWSYSTTLSITGNSTGVSVVTFSNDINSKTFKIIIIVE